ncbi:hypothetical protein PmNV_007 [Penaeus monodon nudivirus]|uniref:Uncharacterized protein n=1 Tax=Penaeus monodon nudivirus TaxID=1529056 RepID=A0A076FDR2_9VIRU|nr:hypothetical protein PmNV_007 [Penaeus monodon nudivirus]AII15795.1 hypothetical protein PmNV_007 [Penaeus monodon nudivirus]
MTHDEYYIKYLQSMFGNASISFFGIILSIVTLILLSIIVLLNSTTVFMLPNVTTEGTTVKLPTTKHVIV